MSEQVSADGKSASNRMRAIALEILEDYPHGIKFIELKKRVAESDTSFGLPSAGWVVWNLAKDTSLIRRTAKNTLMLAKYAGAGGKTEEYGDFQPSLAGEPAFYQPFADWLGGPGDEATEAVVIGGAGFKKKWGTPDVIGVYKSKPSDLIKFPAVIISAEIKIDPSQSIVAFGQAISYRLFSHKTLIAMPKTIEEKLTEDHERLRSLCELFGVGYVLFDTESVDDPNFRSIVPARRFEPDMFYVNAFARILLDLNSEHFDKLFR